jgi:Tol biopolymer transport system component
MSKKKRLWGILSLALACGTLIFSYQNCGRFNSEVSSDSANNLNTNTNTNSDPDNLSQDYSKLNPDIADGRSRSYGFGLWDSSESDVRVRMALSPDQHDVLFSFKRCADPCGYDLYLTDLETNTKRKISQTPAVSTSAAGVGRYMFTLDGKSIVYAYSEETRRPAELFRYDISSGLRFKLSEPNRTVRWVGLSPDRIHVGYVADSLDDKGNLVGNEQLYIAALDGSSSVNISSGLPAGLRRIGENNQKGFSFTPDGQKVVFYSGADDIHSGLYASNIDGTGLVSLTGPMESGDTALFETPGNEFILCSDSQRVLYKFVSGWSSGTFSESLYSVYLDGSRRQKISQTARASFWIDLDRNRDLVSDDCSSIFYWGEDQPKQTMLYSVKFDGTSHRLVTNGTFLHGGNLPLVDIKSGYLSYLQLADQAGHFDAIYRVRLDGNGISKIADKNLYGVVESTGYQISPSGSGLAIFFLANASGTLSTAQFQNMDGSNEHQIVSKNGPIYFDSTGYYKPKITWDENGQIYFVGTDSLVGEDRSLFRYNPTTKSLAKVVDLPANHLVTTTWLSPNFKLLFFSTTIKNSDANNLYMLRLK